MLHEAIDRTASVEEFRHGMRSLASGVSIVATVYEGQWAGLTATAVCSLTTEPPQLLVCVNGSASAHDAIKASGVVMINLLPEKSEHHARRFAGMVEGISGADRFDKDAWTVNASGLPVLREALASFECRVIETMQVGSHSAFRCTVVSVNTSGVPETPLIYFDGAFAGIRVPA